MELIRFNQESTYSWFQHPTPSPHSRPPPDQDVDGACEYANLNAWLGGDEVGWAAPQENFPGRPIAVLGDGIILVLLWNFRQKTQAKKFHPALWQAHTRSDRTAVYQF